MNKNLNLAIKPKKLSNIKMSMIVNVVETLGTVPRGEIDDERN